MTELVFSIKDIFNDNGQDGCLAQSQSKSYHMPAYSEVVIVEQTSKTSSPRRQSKCAGETKSRQASILANGNLSQQYGTPWEELPHGWNGICAFQLLGSDPGLVADLPLVNGGYEQRAHTLMLIAE
jgi:hypothetical protein